MREFDLDIGLACEMVRVLGAAGMEDKEQVKTPEAAVKVLRERARPAISAEYGVTEQHAVESLALQIFFSVFWGEKLDLHCAEGGKVLAATIESHHCTETPCCGPLPVWKDLAFPHAHHN
ncbi:MAG: hypothetical protein H7841_03185 [Magnetospirillum sp. WYHS-4]